MGEIPVGPLRWLGGRDNLKIRFLMAILALGAAVFLVTFVSRPVSAISAETISACGSNIDVRFDNDSKGVTNDVLMN